MSRLKSVIPIGARVGDPFASLWSAERFRVLVPCGDPVADVVLQCGNAFVDTAAQDLFGAQAEPARGEVHVEAAVSGEAVVDGWGLMGGEVVADQMDVQMSRNDLVDGDEELLELRRPKLRVNLARRRCETPRTG